MNQELIHPLIEMITHEYFLEGKGSPSFALKTYSPSYVGCLEFWKPQLPGNLRACPGLIKRSHSLLFCVHFR